MSSAVPDSYIYSFSARSCLVLNVNAICKMLTHDKGNNSFHYINAILTVTQIYVASASYMLSNDKQQSTLVYVAKS